MCGNCLARLKTIAEDDVRGVVADLDAFSLQTREYLDCYGWLWLWSVVVRECMVLVSADIARLTAAKRMTLAAETTF